MSLPLAVVLGVIVGIIGALPPALLLEAVLAGKPVPSPVAVAAAIFAPLVLMCASIALVRFNYATMLLSFALPMVCALIVVWAIEGVRAWMWFRRDTPEERM